MTLCKIAELAEDGKHKLQGHINFQGLNIAVENKKGSTRSGVGKDGKPWHTHMLYDYGYIEDSTGKDGESVDVYVGPNKDASIAYVVHQHKENGKGFDEDKVFLGFDSEDAARKAFLAHYDSPKFLGPISAVPVERLKKMIASGKPTPKIASAFARELLKLARFHCYPTQIYRPEPFAQKVDDTDEENESLVTLPAINSIANQR